MACQKAELLSLFEYIEEECEKRDCKQVIQELKERIRKIAVLETINQLY
ncbi:MAG: hypothetical protein QXF40_03435 [Metallosphaera sp.]